VGKVLFVVLLFGAVVYAFFWYLERRGQRPSPARPTASPRRVVAPDDDEDFLRELERRRRRAAREGKAEKPDPKPRESRPNEKDSKPEEQNDKGRQKPE
jgi:hypothetical protein